MRTNAMQKNKTSFQRPDLSIDKSSEDKAYQLIDNFANGILRQVKENAKEFGTIKAIQRFLKQVTTEDPSDKIIYESIKRMDRDKISPQVSLSMSEIAMKRAQNLQKTSMIKMIPYLLGLAGLLTVIIMSFFSGPFNFTNPAVIRNLILGLLFTGLIIWGTIQRRSTKYSMITASLLHQACSAFASAKLQGKGAVGALQSLAEMRTRAKSMQTKAKAKEAEKKIKDKKTKK
jgi:hypothetical protein